MKQIIALISFTLSLQAFAQETKLLEKGLTYYEFVPKKKSILGDSKISVLKIDPNQFSLRLLNAKELDKKKRTAKKWCSDFNLLAAINAGMFQMDHLTNVGYMQNFQFINSKILTKDNAVLAFNPRNDSLPPVQIIDRQCQNFEALKKEYNALIQGIRMVDCNQKNKWSQQPKMWSIAAIALDGSGNVLFIFSRSPYTVHDFIDILLVSNLDIYNAMYLEGGPEASFHLKNGDVSIEKFGSYETDFFESDENNQYWPIPNVIGVSRKGNE